jgi:hypothetical protein
VKEWREKKLEFWLFLFDRFERIKASAYVPLKGIKTVVVHSYKKYFWWVRLILIVLKMVLRRVARPQGIEE